MAEGFTLDVNLNFDKAIRQMAEFQKKHGTVNVSGTAGVAPGAAGVAAAGTAATAQGNEMKKMAQAVRVTTQVFTRLNASLGIFEKNIAKAGTSIATAAAAKAVPVAGGGALANVGKVGAFAMQLPGITMMAQMVSSPFKKLYETGMGYIEKNRYQKKNELALQGVLGNAGLGSAEFETLRQTASDLQKRTIYGDEALLNASGELATFIKDKNGNVSMGNLQRMLGLLTDYASGMGNNSAMSAEELTSLATGLGQAFDGNYVAMRKKGFDTSELEHIKAIEDAVAKAEELKASGAEITQKQADELNPLIAEYNAAGGDFTNQKVDAIAAALADWSGRAEAFAKTEEGRDLQMKNRLSDVEETIGAKITPAYERLTAAIADGEPSIAAFKGAVGDLFASMAEGLTTIMPTLMASLKDVSLMASAVAKNGTLVGESLRTAGGAMALIISLKFGAAMKAMAVEMKMMMKEMAVAVNGVSSFRAGLNALGKTAIGQAALFVACSWALGKIAEACSAIMQLIDAWDSEAKSDAERELWDKQYDKFAKARENYKNGVPGSWSDYHMAADNLKELNKAQGRDELSGFNSYDLKRLGWEYKAKKPEATVSADQIAADTKGMLTINNSTTNVKQENHIDAGFDELGKLIKENLQEILISRLNFRADVESVRALT